MEIQMLLPIAMLVTLAPNPSFVDHTDTSGIDFQHHLGEPMAGSLPGEVNRFGTGAAVADYDRDGDLDVFIADAGGYPCVLYQNHGTGTFVEVAEAAGVALGAWARGALFVDLDTDGWQDLVVFCDSDGSNENPYSQLYRNDRDGTFTNVSAGSGFEPLLVVFGGATAGDYDRDGDLDLYLTSWLGQRNYLYRNDGGFRFTDATTLAGLALDPMSHWTPVFADFNDDGWIDLFGAVDFDPDYLFLNEGDGTFRLAEQTTSVNNDMGVAVADFDGDGDLDIYTTNITGDDSEDGCCNWLYVNDGSGKFENEAVARDVHDSRWGWGTAFFDAELDGDLDLVAVNGWQQEEWITPASFFVNDGSGNFTEASVAAGLDYVANSRGLLPFDMDRDGDLDLLITDHDGPATLFENTSSRGDNHWLTVRGAPVGSRVVVSTPTRAWHRWVIAGGSFNAAAPPEVQIGVGSTERVDVAIRLPDGTAVDLEDVLTDQVVDVAGEIVGVDTPPTVPSVRAFPNPFQTQTQLDLSPGEFGLLRIYDAAGRLVRSMNLSPAAGRISWDGTNNSGSPVATGVYWIDLDGRPTRHHLIRLH